MSKSVVVVIFVKTWSLQTRSMGLDLRIFPMSRDYLYLDLCQIFVLKINISSFLVSDVKNANSKHLVLAVVIMFVNDTKRQFWNQTETRKLPLVSARWCNFWKHYSLFVLPNLKPASQEKLMLLQSAVVKLDSVISSAKKTLSQQSAGFKITTPRLVRWLSRCPSFKFVTWHNWTRDDFSYIIFSP